MAIGNEEALLDILKELLGQIKYSFLSKDQKIEFNLGQLQQKYWFEQLVLEFPSVVQQIKNDEELSTYLASSRNLRKVLHNYIERNKFKKMIYSKMNEETK